MATPIPTSMKPAIIRAHHILTNFFICCVIGPRINWPLVVMRFMLSHPCALVAFESHIEAKHSPEKHHSESAIYKDVGHSMIILFIESFEEFDFDNAEFVVGFVAPLGLE